MTRTLMKTLNFLLPNVEKPGGHGSSLPLLKPFYLKNELFLRTKIKIKKTQKLLNGKTIWGVTWKPAVTALGFSQIKPIRWPQGTSFQ